MGEFVGWLNDNSGAVVAGATTIYAIVTLLLLAEARRTRQVPDQAAMEAWPTLFGDGLYLSIRLENYGPAIARDVAFELWLIDEGATEAKDQRRHAEPLFPAGRHRTFLVRSGEQMERLGELAARGLTLHLAWEWTDGRRWLWRSPRRHQRVREVALKPFSEGFYEGGALVEREPFDAFPKLVDEVKRMREEVRRLREFMQGPSLRLWLEEMQLETEAEEGVTDEGTDEPES